MRTALVSGIACLALAALVAAGATDAPDRWALDAAQTLAHPALDLVGSLLTLVGRIELTALLAVVLALVGWNRDRTSGLAPLLLFPGVALEVIAKFVVLQPGPPSELARDLRFLPFIESTTPYAFPSGHELRTTFLALMLAPPVAAARAAAWLLIGAMGLTRVYLAEHWASDVIGGLLIGLALAALAARLRR